MAEVLRDRPLDQFSGRRTGDVILEIESRITRGMGRTAAIDVMTHNQSAVDRFFMDPNATTIQFDRSALSRDIPQDTRHRAELAADALFSGGDTGARARRELGLTGNPTFEFSTSTANDPNNRVIRGTFDDCLKYAESMKKPLDCYNLAASNVQKVSIEALMKNLPTRDATGNPLEGWKKIVVDAVQKAARKIDWQKGSNADAWIAAVQTSLEEAATGPEMDKLILILTSPERLTPENQFLVDAEKDSGKKLQLQTKLLAEQRAQLRAEINKTFKNGIAEVLGLKKSSLSSSRAVAGHASFAECIRSPRTEDTQAILKRVECLKGAKDDLEEPVIEWIAKNFPQGPNPHFAKISTIVRDAANSVYPPGTSFPRNQKAETMRVEKLARLSGTRVFAASLVGASDQLFRHVSSSAGNAVGLLPEQEKTLSLRSEWAAAQIWGQDNDEFINSADPSVQTGLRASGNPMHDVTLSNRFDFPGAPKGGGTLQQCLRASSSISNYHRCFALAQDALDEVAHEFSAKNIFGPQEAEPYLGAVRDAAYEVYGTPHETDPEKIKVRDENLKKTESERFTLFAAKATGRSAKYGMDRVARTYDWDSDAPPAIQEQSRTRGHAVNALGTAAAESAERAVLESGDRFKGKQTHDLIEGASQRDENGLYGADKAALEIVEKVGSDPNARKPLNNWIASMILGSDGEEGLAKFNLAQRSRVGSNSNFYKRFATSLNSATDKLAPENAEALTQYIKGLDPQIKTAIAEAMPPLMDELFYQATCDEKAPPREGSLNPACACKTLGGFLRTPGPHGGNLFSSEVSLVANLMRDAGFETRALKNGSMPEKIGCADKLKKFLKDSMPQMVRDSKASFIENPHAIMGEAIMKDGNLSPEDGPGIIHCIIIGNIQEHVLPFIDALPDTGLAGLKGNIQNFMKPSNLLKIFQGTHPLNAKNPEVAENLRRQITYFAKTMSNPQDFPANTTPAEFAKKFIASSAESLTALGLQSPAATKPIIYSFDQGILPAAIGVNVSEQELNVAYATHKDEMNKIGADLVRPFAIVTGAMARKALDRERISMSKELANECAEGNRSPLVPFELPDAADIAKSPACVAANAAEMKASEDINNLFADIKKINRKWEFTKELPMAGGETFTESVANGISKVYMAGVTGMDAVHAAADNFGADSLTAFAAQQFTKVKALLAADDARRRKEDQIARSKLGGPRKRKPAVE